MLHGRVEERFDGCLERYIMECGEMRCMGRVRGLSRPCKSLDK